MKKILAVLLALIIIPLSMQTYNADESSETALNQKAAQNLLSRPLSQMNRKGSLHWVIALLVAMGLLRTKNHM